MFNSFSRWFSGVWHDATLKINIEESHHGASSSQLLRQFGLFSVIMFTITQAVGSGILTTPGIIAHDYAGPHAWLSFLWAGLICAPPALCLARMASKTAISGSTGSYACLVLGQFVGLLMFTDVAMECIGGTAAVAVSQSDHIKMIYKLIGEEWFGFQNVSFPNSISHHPVEIYWSVLLPFLGFTALAGWLIPSGWHRLKQPAAPGTRVQSLIKNGGRLLIGVIAALVGVVCGYHFFVASSSINFLSMAVVGVITIVLLRGVKETAFWTNLFTVCKLVTLSIAVLIFFQHYNPDLLNLPVPDNMPGALAGASVAFFAFVGLDLTTTMAGETRNSKFNVPVGMLVGLACVTLLYFLASYYLMAAVPYHMLGKGGEGQSAPMIRALEILDHKTAAIWIGIGSTIALVSVVLASAYSTTRLLFNMSQHGLIPKVFSQVSEKRKVPVVATLTVGGFIALLTALLDVDELMHLTNVGTMTAFITVSLTVLILTVRDTEWRKPRSAFFGVLWVVVALLGIAGPFRLMIELPLEAFVRLFAVWILVGVLFVTYSRKHSLARKQENEKKENEKTENDKK